MRRYILYILTAVLLSVGEVQAKTSWTSLVNAKSEPDTSRITFHRPDFKQMFKPLLGRFSNRWVDSAASRDVVVKDSVVREEKPILTDLLSVPAQVADSTAAVMTAGVRTEGAVTTPSAEEAGSTALERETVPVDNSAGTDDPGRSFRFMKGSGAVIDTLDVGDPSLLVILCDDYSWKYIKNVRVLEQTDDFRNNWTENVVNPYKEVEIKDLPYCKTFVLRDSVSKFTCPHVNYVISKFGFRRGRRHQGVDVPLHMGDSLRAAWDGRVRVSDYCGGYGNLVIIRHDNGLETFYGHMSKRLVEPGDWVNSGDIIGLGGSTGRSTGPHLHFETRYQGYAFDPQWIVDFNTGALRSNVFVLRRSYLNAASRYVPESIDEEEDQLKTEEDIIKEEKRREAELAAMRYHKVRKGDTVGAICRKYGVSQAKIKKLNPNININRISIGQRIRVN